MVFVFEVHISLLCGICLFVHVYVFSSKLAMKVLLFIIQIMKMCFTFINSIESNRTLQNLINISANKYCKHVMFGDTVFCIAYWESVLLR